ncbi:MAG: RNA-binding protein [Chloroflexota bacterium]
MEKRLYVGNLPYQTTSEELAEFFTQVGEVVDATVVQDRETGRSRGFGFVEMADEQAAADAVEQLNGKAFGGRTLKVSESKPRAPRDDRAGGGSGGGYGRGGGGGGGGYDRGGGGYGRDRR